MYFNDKNCKNEVKNGPINEPISMFKNAFCEIIKLDLFISIKIKASTNKNPILLRLSDKAEK